MVKWLNPDERIPVEAAIRAVTIDAAWQWHMDDLTGSIKAGKAADFVILEDNPLTADLDKISQIKVSETWLDGSAAIRLTEAFMQNWLQHKPGWLAIRVLLWFMPYRRFRHLGHSQARSLPMAMPCPTPMHTVASAYLPLLSRQFKCSRSR
ncbi:amidohydrolase family protein [Brucella abortus]|nr:amidohydrolase family protein [Brucella abortus]